MKKRILGLGTYPIENPIHGGQRRVDRFRSFYSSIGIEYVYACVYDKGVYSRPDLGKFDIALQPIPTEYGDVPFIDDLKSGRFASRSGPALSFFRTAFQRIKPDAIQLEQPYLFPLVRRLEECGDLHGRTLIYSSQNIEASLKRAILTAYCINPKLVGQIIREISDLERDVCLRSALVVCASPVDAIEYSKWGADNKLCVVRNGVDRFPPLKSDSTPWRHPFSDERFLFFVGSAYPPNIQGFCDLVISDGIFFRPPIKSFAVCGGVSRGILNSREFQRFSNANNARIQFFPKVDDNTLWGIKNACHSVILPITTGGGSNLKTAEALSLGKWIIATDVALRGFEELAQEEGVLIANDPAAFRRAMVRVFDSPPLTPSAQSMRRREAVYWDRCFLDSGLCDALQKIGLRGS